MSICTTNQFMNHDEKVQSLKMKFDILKNSLDMINNSLNQKSMKCLKHQVILSCGLAIFNFLLTAENDTGVLAYSQENVQ